VCAFEAAGEGYCGQPARGWPSSHGPPRFRARPRRALGIGPGDEVLCPDLHHLSFLACARSSRLGRATPWLGRLRPGYPTPLPTVAESPGRNRPAHAAVLGVHVVTGQPFRTPRRSARPCARRSNRIAGSSRTPAERRARKPQIRTASFRAAVASADRPLRLQLFSTRNQAGPPPARAGWVLSRSSGLSRETVRSPRCLLQGPRIGRFSLHDGRGPQLPGFAQPSQAAPCSQHNRAVFSRILRDQAP